MTFSKTKYRRYSMYITLQQKKFPMHISEKLHFYIKIDQQLFCWRPIKQCHMTNSFTQIKKVGQFQGWPKAQAIQTRALGPQKKNIFYRKKGPLYIWKEGVNEKSKGLNNKQKYLFK